MANSVTDWQRERLVPLYGNLPIGELLQKWWDSLGYPAEDTLSNQKLYDRYKLALPSFGPVGKSLQDYAYEFWSQGLIGSAVRLPGITGNYITTPDSVLNSITGDIDVRFKVAPVDWTPAANEQVVGKRGGAGQRGWYIYRQTNGRWGAGVSGDGTAERFLNPTSTAANLVDGQARWGRFTRVASTGTFFFYDSLDGLTWTSLGGGVDTIGPLFDNTASLNLGTGSGSEMFVGDVLYFELRNGIDGPIVVKYDASDVVVTGTRLPATISGWTINGTGITQPDVDYLKLPGTAGNYVSMPDSPKLSLLGDFELVCRVSADDWTPTGAKDLITKYYSTGSQRSYEWLLNTDGTLSLWLSSNGTTGSERKSTVATGITDGVAKYLKVTFDADNGSAQNETKFYTSDNGNVWTPLGDTVTVAGVFTIFDSTAVLSLGAKAQDNAQFWAGRYYYAEIRNGLGAAGTVVAKFDAREIETPWVINGSDWSWAGSAPVNLQEMSLDLNGSLSYFQTPDSVVNSVVEDIDVRIQVSPDVSGAFRVLVSKNGGPGARSWYIGLNGDGSPAWGLSTDGTAQDFGGNSPITLTAPFWVRFTRVKSTGVGKAEVSSDGLTWVQQGSSKVFAAGTNLFDTAALLGIGAHDGGGSAFVGKIHYAEVRNGIDGPVVARFDPSAVAKTGTRLPTTLTQPGGSPNLITPNQASIETDASGWITGSGAPVIARSTAQFLDGVASLSIVATAVGPAAMSAYLQPLTTVPVIPGKSYTAKISFRTALTARSCSARILWMNAASGFVSASVGTSVGDTSSGWTEGIVTGVAPATAAYGRIEAYIDAVVATEEHFIDRISLVETPVVWTAAGSAWDWEAVAA
jgi:hypothetical protein